MDTPYNERQLTSAQLFHARLEGGPEVLPGISRESVPSIDFEAKAPAEIVTWRNGWLDVWGLLVDPGLGDVPIEAKGWCRWWTRRKLIEKQHEADRVGQRLAFDVYRDSVEAHEQK